ncbi:MAG: MFS transporter [Anaerolineales bacterium]|nr:MFS transporter [Anaerolineales bacterium]
MTEQADPIEQQNWQRRFFTIWTGQAFSILGSQLVQFALVWYLTRETGSAVVLTTATLVALLPSIFIGPLAGSFVDRGNRRRIMMIADTSIALLTLTLAILFALDVVEIWHIYVLMFLRSLGGSFHGPAMAASTSLMVPKRHLARIQGINQMLGGGLNIIAAPLGALLLELLPMQGVLAVDVVTAMLAVLPLFFFQVPQPEKLAAGAEPTSFWQDFQAGFRYVFQWKGLLIILLMATAINFMLTPAGALTPLLITKYFNGGVKDLALFDAVFSVGVIVGGLVLGAWGGFKRQVATVLVGIIGIGLFSFVVGVVPPNAFLWAVASMFGVGIAVPVTNGSLGAIFQTAVDPGMQGRVFTLIGSVATAASPISLVLSGPLSDRFGVQAWYMAGGLVCALIGVAGFFMRPLMSVEKGHPSQQAAAPEAATAG